MPRTLTPRSRPSAGHPDIEPIAPIVGVPPPSPPTAPVLPWMPVAGTVLAAPHDDEAREGGIATSGEGRTPGALPPMPSARRRRLSTLERRAMALWPRLNSRALRRCGQDPRRIALLVSHRTSLSVEVIVAMLLRPSVTAQETETWFG